MNTKKQLTMIILITGMMVTGIVYGEDPVKGSDTTTTGMGWQESTKRTLSLMTDGLKISAGIGINPTGPTLNVGISSNVTLVECCKATTIKESWCNYNADDERCPD